MSFDPIATDPLEFDPSFPARNAPIAFESNGARVFGMMLIASGAGSHPTILLLHGVPGNERNFDLAQVFRRAGWNAVVFHYRGSWGSHGTYSFAHVLEDTRTAVDYLRSGDAHEKLQVDPSKIILMGHSLGAFAALTAAATDAQIHASVSIALFDLGAAGKEIEKNESYRNAMENFFVENVERLQGTSAVALFEEMISNRDAWHLTQHAKKLAERSLLFIDASRDTLFPPAIHSVPLVQALRAHSVHDLTHVTIESDHAFCDRRLELARTIVAWLGKQ